MPLTDTSVRDAQPQSKTVRLYDGAGLHLEISPSGGKWWRIKYRFQGKHTGMALGVYPAVSLDQARKERDAAKELLASGIDPAARKKESKARERAARLQGDALPSVVINIDDTIMVRKGRSAVCLTVAEAQAVSKILSQLFP